jgi:hypothetical protein
VTKKKATIVAGLAAALLAERVVLAHFLWLAPVESGAAPVIVAHFSEAADDPEPDLFARIEGLVVRARSAGKKSWTVPTRLTENGFAPESAEPAGELFAEKDWGVISRGGATFRLKYAAKTFPAGLEQAELLGANAELAWDLSFKRRDGRLFVAARWKGQPAADVAVTWSGPTGKPREIKTNQEGEAEIPAAEPGLHALRARHVEAAPGELDGKAYGEIRHYATATFVIPAAK